MGLVRSVNETPTRLDYFIDDMSSNPIEVRQFVDNDVSILTFELIMQFLPVYLTYFQVREPY